MRSQSAHAGAIVVLLAAIAVVSPAPAESNRDFYQHSGRQLLIPGCQGGDCFRPLIPTVLERLPGPSLVKWKAYAVAANAIGAIAVARFALMLGLSPTGALAAMWLSAFGAGALYSIFDCYTSDSLMYMLGPVMAIWLWRGRYARAGIAGLVGVMAKEFAAAPIWIFAMWAVLRRRRVEATRLLLAAAAVTLVWLAAHASFMAVENYAYGATASADLLHGGFLATWLRSVRLGGAIAYLFTSFGALYLSFPVGFMRAGPNARLLALAALPALAALVYVEQPERALWNFHFIAVPLAALVLEALPESLIALFVASFGIANLRFGAQLSIRGVGRMALIVSLAIAAFASVRALRQKNRALEEESPAESAAPLSPVRTIAAVAVQVAVFAGLVLVLFDVAAHRRDEGARGVNQWGHRGALVAAPHAGLNVSLVGGSLAFAARTPLPGTIASQLSNEINARMHWTSHDGPYATVVNLSEQGAGASSYITTLRDYAYLQPDIICVYDGYDPAAAMGTLGRHRSVIFRLTGYLPRSPVALLRQQAADSIPEPAPDALIRDGSEAGGDAACDQASAAYCAAIADTVRFVLDRGGAVVVATPPYLSARHEAQQRSLASALDRAFGRDTRFRYVDLGRAIDLNNPAHSPDGVHPTLEGARAVAVQLADRLLDLVPAHARIQ